MSAVPALRVVSFGYGHDSPAPEADITVDVRDWFRDPHVSPELRNMTGLDKQVQTAVAGTPGVPDFVRGLHRTVSVLINLQVRTVTVAVGCVGGRHRAVAIADMLGGRVRRFGRSVEVVHLHVDRPVISRETAGGAR